MHLNISTQDGVPIYLQIVQQIKLLVVSGRLQAGDELPAIRTLAEQLTVNPNTVARAYRELEVAGIVEKRRTAGTFIADQGSPLAKRERHKLLAERIDQLLAEAEHLSVPFEDLLKLMQQRQSLLEQLSKTGRKA